LRDRSLTPHVAIDGYVSKSGKPPHRRGRASVALSGLCRESGLPQVPCGSPAPSAQISNAPYPRCRGRVTGCLYQRP
jgi:hypothetical protein